MIDTKEAGSPGWWLRRLMKDLAGRQTRLDRLDRYYRGQPDLPVGAEKQGEAFQRLLAKSRSNFAELVVEAVRERMQPAGFRTGAGGELGDAEAWRIWQANALDADSALVHRSMLSMGLAYVIVGGVDADIGVPLITPEDPRQVITAHDPVRRRKVVAALKTFTDDVDDVDRAYLYLPGLVYQATKRRSSRATSTSSTSSSTFSSGWDWVNDGTPEELPHPVVPVVEFANKADLHSAPMGEFEGSIDILDRINHMLLQRLVIATLQAFRQRAVKGVPTHDEQGNEIDYDDIFAAGPDALWLLPPNAEMWESGQVDLSGILQGVRHDVQDLAAVTRTPLFYLTPDAAGGSAEGASLAREGLVFKTGDRLVQTGESWEQVMSHAFLFASDETRARRGDMECLWQPPERFSLAERFDAAVKARAAEVPWRTVMTEVLQLSPQQVERMELERAAELLLNPPAPTPALNP